ncbi:MAG: flagellar GTP-binding protein [Isosphaeraceae bacterium]|nr:flagellar GTP-binding protein [Isosphaeraceae bacterium]
MGRTATDTKTATRTYRAGTLREALALVRRDLGGGAVILGTREIRRRRLFGLGRREVVEVSAAAQRFDLQNRETVDAAAPPHPLPIDKVGTGLADLHARVEELSRRGRIDFLLPDLPSELIPIYASLLESDVSEAMARRLVRRIAERLDPAELRRADIIKSALREVVEDCIDVAPPVAAVEGTRRTIALVGPTGVGKTTTVAKLAAEFKLSRGIRPGLVTVDTYRIAAVEQLRTYADILDIPLRIAVDPLEIRRSIDELGDVDLVLIDTAGRSPRDEVKIRELGEFLESARPDETHLVLSAAASEKSLLAAVDRFACVRADRVILTKLDEAESFGGVLSILGRADRPISYITTGQAVPDDIEPANRSRLAALILGQEVIA